ncbi:GNAT family N-acetyltransferase [Catenuloplanes japonicus]|uniref:GNAT family N-acetyltransferase n=1 Tax=Catenuloplanes japonicus TaxID=33876 RepID=UPI000A67EB56|nr:GNAT family N-acetyltransferase [Catenuloplanes japonicus]
MPLTHWTLRPATPADVALLAEIRADVMRADLVRLGRYDPVHVRRRFRDAFRAADTQVIEIGGVPAGCVALRPADGTYWLEHFYLARHAQGTGIGSAVLTGLLARADTAGLPVRLTVLRGSPARRLYARHGFVLESDDDPIDVLLVRPPLTSGRSGADPGRRP